MTIAAVDRTQLSGTGVSDAHAKPLLDKVDELIVAMNAGLGGVLAPVADIAALKAIAATVRTDKVQCLVEDSGLYRFDADSAVPGDDEYVVAPTAGTGRWILVMRAALPRGIADPVADLAALKAVGAVDLAGRTLYFCETLGLYAYNADSAAAGDDVTVIVPDAITPPDPGRFLLVAPISTAALETKATVASRIVGPLANLAALKGVAEAGRSDQTMALVETLGLYRFDADSAVAGDDVDTVEPDAGAGRWIRVAPLAGGLFYTQTRAALAPTLAADHVVVADNDAPNADPLYVQPTFLGTLGDFNSVAGGNVNTAGGGKIVVPSENPAKGSAVYLKGGVLVADLSALGVTALDVSILGDGGRVLTVTHDAQAAVDSAAVNVDAAQTGLEATTLGNAPENVAVSTTKRISFALPTIS